MLNHPRAENHEVGSRVWTGSPPYALGNIPDDRYREPWLRESLEAVRRSYEGESLAMASAQELVQSCSTIFTLPEIYFRVRDVVDSPDSSMNDLANALKIDPAISARVLKIVNSPLYGFPKQAVRDLVTATTIGRRFCGMTTEIMDLSAYWRKSTLCALMAAKIAKACGIRDSERFFIEGLLRDIGHLILYQTIPQRAQAALIEAGK